MAELPWALKAWNSDEVHFQIWSNSPLKKWWLTTGNQELEANTTTLIMWIQHFCFELENIFISWVFWIIFTGWNASESTRWECFFQDKHPETRPPLYNNPVCQ